MVAKKVYVIKDNSNGLNRPRRTGVEKNYAMWGGGSATVVTPVEDTNGDIILAELACVPSVVGNRVMNVKPVKNERKRKLAVEEECMDPEEEEKRRLRRDRNRLAAAKCRKKRLDQISELQIEVDGWERRNRQLEDEIAALKAEKEEMAFIIEAHRTSCKLQTGSEEVFVKMEAEADPVTSVMVQVAPEPLITTSKPARPASLSLTPRTIEGVSIDTPSNAILSFDTLLEGRTGLTPMEGRTGLTPMTLPTPLKGSLNTPTCGSQQRSIVFTPLFSPNTEKCLLTL